MDKYEYLKTEIFDFPQELNESEKDILNERMFMEFILKNDWVQRMIGIKFKIKPGFFPDLIGEIYDDKGGAITVEIEYQAENYNRHHHLWGGCDLILSFIRNKDTNCVRGVPVWSFYKKGNKGSNKLFYCLDDDIRKN